MEKAELITLKGTVIRTYTYQRQCCDAREYPNVLGTVILVDVNNFDHPMVREGLSIEHRPSLLMKFFHEKAFPDCTTERMGSYVAISTLSDIALSQPGDLVSIQVCKEAWRPSLPYRIVKFHNDTLNIGDRLEEGV